MIIDHSIRHYTYVGTDHIQRKIVDWISVLPQTFVLLHDIQIWSKYILFCYCIIYVKKNKKSRYSNTSYVQGSEFEVLTQWFDYLTQSPDLDLKIDLIIYLRTDPEVVSTSWLIRTPWISGIYIMQNTMVEGGGCWR